MALRNYLKATRSAVGNLLTKPNTVKFPLESVETPEGYRGTPVMNPENCTLCKKCERVCPTLAIAIEQIEGDSYSFTIDLGRCCYCGECEAECNFDSIHLHPTWMTSEMDREKLKRIETVEKKRRARSD
ncbi:MAG: 4Fe-4S binding protein [Candidatus Heimdallarchaeota archaeon]|nr:4Fe-4S binding protein [Candidatus Heimdallarchaeota archaeon]